jgi:O-antigen/teichoic acid export membrane protein
MEKSRITPSRILAKNTLYNLFGMVIPLCIGVLSIPFAIKGLGADKFGILSIAWVILGYLALLDFGLSRATTKFVAEFIAKKRVESLNSTIWTAMIVSVGLGVVGGLLLLAAIPFLVENLLQIPEEFVEQTKNSFILFSYALPFILLSTSLKGMLGATQRFDLVNLVHVPVSALNFVFPALSLPLGLSLSSVILCIALTRIAGAVIYFLICLKVLPIQLSKPTIEYRVFRKLIRYGGWITVSGVISPLLVYLDRFFIGSVLSMENVTFYSAPYEAITRLRIIPIAIMTTFFPEFSVVSSQNKRRTEMLFCRSLKFVIILNGFIAVLLFYFAKDILQLWLGGEFAETSTVLFKIFTVGIVVNSLAYIPFTLFQGAGRPDIPAKFHMIEFPIYVFFLWLLIKKYEIKGVAIAWMGRVSLDFLLHYVRVFQLYPDFLRAMKKNRVIDGAILLFGLSLTLFIMNIFCSHLLTRMGLIIVVFIVAGWIVWRYIFDSAERKWIASLFSRRLYPKTVRDV